MVNSRDNKENTRLEVVIRSPGMDLLGHGWLDKTNCCAAWSRVDGCCSSDGSWIPSLYQSTLPCPLAQPNSLPNHPTRLHKFFYVWRTVAAAITLEHRISLPSDGLSRFDLKHGSITPTKTWQCAGQHWKLIGQAEIEKFDAAGRSQNFVSSLCWCWRTMRH